MKSINHNAPVTSTNRKITINTSSEKVWSVLTDISNWTSWNTEVSNVKLNGDVKPGTTFDWKTGGAKIRSTLHTVEPHKYFGWTGKALGVSVIHNWTLNEVNGKTEVMVDESMEGFLVKLFRKAFQESLDKGIQKWFDLLKQACER